MNMPMRREVKSERCIRRRLKEFLPAKQTLWIEPGAGSTFGVPDLFLIGQRRLTAIELKFGRVASDQLKIAIRPKQKQVLKTLIEWEAYPLWALGVRYYVPVVLLPVLPHHLDRGIISPVEEGWLVDESAAEGILLGDLPISRVEMGEIYRPY